MASEWVVFLTKSDLCQSIKKIKKKNLDFKKDGKHYLLGFVLVLILSNFEGLNLHENFNVLTKYRRFARSFWGLACYQECKQKDVMAILT